MFDKILFATDFSESAHFAFDYALDLTQRYNAPLLIVHVAEPLVAPLDLAWGTLNLPEIEKQVQDYARENLDKLKAEVPEGIAVETHLLVGKPWREIVRFAKEQKVDLIVVATHGQSGFSHALYGSTAEKIVRKAYCAVLTVRHPEVEFEMP